MAPIWRRILIVSGVVLGIAIVALLAVIAYALLSEEDGEPAAQVAQPTTRATPRPVVTRTPVATPSPTPRPPTPTATPEPTPEPESIVEEPPPAPPPTEEPPPPPPPTEEPPVPTEPPLAPPPTQEPEAVCEPGYVLAAPGVCCPSDSPVLVWGEVCLAEGYGDYPTLAVDQVTFWFFGLMGLVPTAEDVTINRLVCQAAPDMPRYWRVKCSDTGGEYLVAHDGTLDVQPANDIALALVAAILVSPATPPEPTRSPDLSKCIRWLAGLSSLEITGRSACRRVASDAAMKGDYDLRKCIRWLAGLSSLEITGRSACRQVASY